MGNFCVHMKPYGDCSVCAVYRATKRADPTDGWSEGQSAKADNIEREALDRESTERNEVAKEES